MKELLNRLHIFLSHHSVLYALIAGIGIVLFWRGVWHSVDMFHLYINHYAVSSPLDSVNSPWWDGPLSFIVGCIILYATRAFVSSFIGNELILSGLREEKKLTHQTESEVKTEISSISDIKNEISIISDKLEDLESQVKDHHIA
jgi:hypothetical protein